jgi:type II secretory pathway component PulF
MLEESSQQTAATIEEQQQVRTSETDDWRGSRAPVSPEPYLNEEEEQFSGLNKLRKFRFEFGPGKKDILHFTNQLSVMIRAGISLLDALESIAQQCEKQKFKVILLDLKAQIESGQSFSQALAEYPKVFSNLYINMVGAAEASGSLSEMLQKLAEYLDREAETSSQVKSACVYPIIIAVMAVSVTVFLLVFVLPRFTLVFAGKEHLLPLPTKALIAISSFLRNYWYLHIPAFGAALWGFWYFVRTSLGKAWWDRMKLVLPLIKTLCRCLYITRSLHTMGVLSRAGVPILNTISITAQISGNSFYKEMWLKVHEDVRQGKKIADSLRGHIKGAGRRSGLMPSDVVQMIRSGEDSGTMSEVLRDISEYYSRELKTIIKTVTSMIEPIMIVLMGVLVGFIAMSIILPIFKMSSLVAGR